ncbi:sigma 54-interacting transcriptional regulator [Planctomycetota bacterium]
MKGIIRSGSSFSGQIEAVDLDFNVIINHPLMQSLVGICEYYFNQSFAVLRAGGTDSQGGIVTAATYRFPGLPIANPFCSAIKALSRKGYEKCREHYSAVLDEIYQTGSIQMSDCRFGCMSCLNCAPLLISGSIVGHIGLLGIKRYSDPQIPFAQIAGQLRQDDPGIDLQNIEDAYQDLKSAPDEMLGLFIELATYIVNQLAQHKYENIYGGADTEAATIDLSSYVYVTGSISGTQGSIQEDVFANYRDIKLPILIEGESGTGKETVARQIHKAGRGKNQPFIVVNCAELNPNLVEAELFGYSKGAFTGAEKDFAGFFERANGGTLFFDEIAELPLDVQPGLLRLIENGEVRPIGSDHPVKIDIRIIIGTSTNLKELMDRGKFAKELYYRINTVHVPISPLRDYPDDIPLYAQTFLDEVNQKLKSKKEFSKQAMKLMQKYLWPGNMRQLKDAVLSSAAGARNKIGARHLPEEIRQYDPQKHSHTTQLDHSWKAFQQQQKDREKQHLEMVLKSCRGNVSQAARILEMGRRTLYDKIQALNIQV